MSCIRTLFNEDIIANAISYASTHPLQGHNLADITTHCSGRGHSKYQPTYCISNTCTYM